MLYPGRSAGGPIVFVITGLRFCFLVSFLALATGQTASGQTKTSPRFEPAINLSNNQTSGQVPDVAASGSNVYVVWNDLDAGGPFRIRFRRSTDEGRTFEDAVDLSNPTARSSSGRPRVAASGSDVFVIWEDTSGSVPGSPDIFFRRSIDGGQSWDSPVDLSETPYAFSAHPAIAVAGPNVYVVWEETLPATHGTVSQPAHVVIRFRRSVDQGSSFDPYVDLSVNGSTKLPTVDGDSVNPSIAAVGSFVCVVWNNESSPDNPLPPAEHPQIWMLASIEEGINTGQLGWYPPEVQNISNTTGTARNPTVSAAGNAVFAAWEDDSASDPSRPTIFYNVASWDVVTRSPTFLFSKGHNIGNLPTAPALAPRAAVAGSEFSFIWHDRSSGTFELALSIHTLTSLKSLDTLQVQQITSTPLGYSIRPSLAMTGSRFYVAWVQNTSNPNNPNAADVMFMRSVPIDGLDPMNLSMTPGSITVTPSVAVDGTDVYVAWSGQFQIYFLASFDGGNTFTFKGTPANISNTAGFATDPDIVASGHSLYVIWADDTDHSPTPGIIMGVPDIVFRQSTDRGNTWFPPVSEPPSKFSDFGATSPKLASRSAALAATGGEVYAAWEDDTQATAHAETPQVFFRRSVAAATQSPWDPPLEVSPQQITCISNSGRAEPQCKARTPSLAAAGSNVYGIWQLDNSGHISIQFNAAFDQSAPAGGGATFQSGCGDGTLDSANFPPFPQNPRIAAVGSSVHAVWLRGGEIYYRRAQVDGQICTWYPSLGQDALRLSLATHAAHAPVIAAAGQDVYVAWAEDVAVPRGTVPAIRLVTSRDGGQSFLAPSGAGGFLLSPENGADAPSLAADGPDVYVAWQQYLSFPALQYAPSDVFLRSSTNEGAIFPEPPGPGGECVDVLCPLDISTTSIAGGVVGLPYSQSLDANGGTPPYFWTITSGRLPAGLAFDGATGRISGIPVHASSSIVTFQVNDSTAQTQTAAVPLVLTVSP